MWRKIRTGHKSYSSCVVMLRIMLVELVVLEHLLIYGHRAHTPTATLSLVLSYISLPQTQTHSIIATVIGAFLSAA